MKQPPPSLIGFPLLFIVACVELVAGDDSSGVHDCRLKVEKVERAAKPASSEHPEKLDRGTPAADRKAPPAAPEPVHCDEGEPPGELWDGTGRSEAVRGA
jgi:hypothetical protein